MNALSPSIHPDTAAAEAFAESFAKSEITRKDLSPQMQRIAIALRDYCEMINIEVHTTAAHAVEDLLAAMPVIPGHENDILLLVRAIVDDIPEVFKDAAQPLFLRFVNQDNEDKIKDIAPAGTSHIVMVPVATSLSLHATPQNEAVVESMDRMASDMRRRDEMSNEWFVVVADPSAKMPPAALQGERVQVRQPLDAKQIEDYVATIRTIQLVNQVMADSMLSMGAGAMLGQLNAYTGTILPMLKNANNDVAKIGAIQASRFVHRSAQQVEQQLKTQIAKMQIPAVTREAARAGLQRMRSVQSSAGIVSPNGVSNVVMRSEPLARASVAVNTPTLPTASAVPVASPLVNVSVATPHVNAISPVVNDASPVANNVVQIPVRIEAGTKKDFVPGLIPVFGTMNSTPAAPIVTTVTSMSATVTSTAALVMSNAVAAVVVPAVTPAVANQSQVFPATVQATTTAPKAVDALPITLPVVELTKLSVQEKTERQNIPPVVLPKERIDSLETKKPKREWDGDGDFKKSPPLLSNEPKEKPPIWDRRDPKHKNGSELVRFPITGSGAPPPIIVNPVVKDFKQAAKGACANCGGGGCAHCTRGHISANKDAQIRAFLATKKHTNG